MRKNRDSRGGDVSIRGYGILPTFLRSFAGRVGQISIIRPAMNCLPKSDVIVTDRVRSAGVRPSDLEPPPSARLIHIDANRAEIDSYYSPAVEVMGDIAASLSALFDLRAVACRGARCGGLSRDAIVSKRAVRSDAVNQYTGIRFILCALSPNCKSG